MVFKLSPSSIADFLKSPKLFYWTRIFSMDGTTRGIEPVMPSSDRYDHDKIFGICWAEFIHRFYTEPNISLDKNLDIMQNAYTDMTNGWLDSRYSKAHLDAMNHLAPIYYERFSPDDGVRYCPVIRADKTAEGVSAESNRLPDAQESGSIANGSAGQCSSKACASTQQGSELWRESELFVARLDGLSADGIVHECKATSHAHSLSQQLYKYQNSIQTKLYSVLTDAKGILIELAFKDKPYDVFRAPVRAVTEEEKREWAAELADLAHAIHACRSFPCHPEGCSYAGKRSTSTCPYQVLCDGHMEFLPIAFRPRTRRT